MIKLVIFDLDGVLIDACEWHRVALNMALKQFLNYEIPIEEHYRIYNGLPTKKKLDILQKREDFKLEFEDKVLINSFKQANTMDLIQNEAKRDQSKVDLINFLKDRNVQVSCFTNSIRHTTELMLSQIGVLELLDVVISNEEVQQSKPDPEGYNKIMSILKVRPEETIIVEDSPKGLEAAFSSGAKIILPVKNATKVNTTLFEDICFNI